MFRFEAPIYLYLLVIVPIMAAVRWFMMRSRKKKLAKFGDAVLLAQLMPNVSKIRRTVKFWILQTALAMIIIMLARPQLGAKISNDKRNGIEAVIALDISNSMRAKDVMPSRLEKSKMLIENMVDNFTNDKVGLVVFAGDAFIQLPITSDYVSAKMFMQNTEPNLIASQGTNIGEALRIASSSFTKAENIGRAIIIITDGEDHEGGAEEAAAAAKKKGMNVFVLGVGSSKGSLIPDDQGGYVKDDTGSDVISALNEDMCRRIAEAGGGGYIHVDNTNVAQEKLNAALAKLQKGEFDSVIYSEYDEQFRAVAIIVLLLLIAEVCIMESRNPMLRNIRLFKRKTNLGNNR
ncbi:vWA domain-containing protein [Prevotella sp. OH937_COT-195]|uniref:vWA domain-containing protein n=1 Tax=Prevotella sp. OH937_COT-195 TaxID=2491051 RepID=UPI000F645CE2|nr:VWA domain-containing protein [Prevotella sp. OH937_COT-195]RRD02978.1 VWA domain-containing protein [Prevotella sp. OH937_COT-195]